MASYDYVPLPLYADSFYAYSVSLEGNTYSVEILYNERNKLWHMSLFTEDGDPIVQGVAIVPQYPILQNYKIDDLSGFFWLTPVPSLTSEKYITEPESLNQYYTFKYITNFVDN